jgi:hypothetical protein
MAVAFRVETSEESPASVPPHALLDISSSGIRIRSVKAVPSGETVEIRFPDIDPDFVARARVVWCEPRDEAEFDLGLRLEGESSDYERIFTWIQEIEKYRQTVEDLRGQPVAPADAARQWLSRFGHSV